MKKFFLICLLIYLTLLASIFYFDWLQIAIIILTKFDFCALCILVVAPLLEVIPIFDNRTFEKIICIMFTACRRIFYFLMLPFLITIFINR